MIALRMSSTAAPSGAVRSEINKTSAAVYAEVGQSNLETAAAAVAGDPVSRQATNSITSFFF